MTTQSTEQQLTRVASVLGIDHIERHIFICCHATNPKCCSLTQANASWAHLKQRLNDLKAKGHTSLYRTKANCLQVCCHGPIAVVYPDGIWYHSCTPEVIDEIIDQHLLKGKVVEAYCFQGPSTKPD